MTGVPAYRQFFRFLIHLRWHYQVGILAGPYLLGGVLSGTMEWEPYLLQFLNVHLLLFGGATAYNSWHDRDDGPVGGLRHPPPMEPWMGTASLLLQAGGLFLAARAGLLFAATYAAAMLLFWLYSRPRNRWKGSPGKSLAAIGLSTGVCPLLMGLIAAGAVSADLTMLMPALAGAMGVILSLYPVSQVYQVEEDRRRGDRTFAIAYGPAGVIRLFRFTWFPGVLLISLALGELQMEWGLLLAAGGLTAGVAIDRILHRQVWQAEGYGTVMRIKFGASFLFTGLLIVLLFTRHG